MRPNIFFNRVQSRPQSDAAVDLNADMQWWYFDGKLDDGGRLLLFYVPVNYGALEGHDFGLPFVNVAFRHPDGKYSRARRFFSPTEIIPAPNSFGAKFGKDCEASFEPGWGTKGLGRYRLKVKAGNFDCDLFLEPDMPPWSLLGSKGQMPHLVMAFMRRSLFTKDYTHYVPFVPHGRLSGWVKTDGESIPINGIGYHEQGRNSFPLYEMVPEWYWLHIEHRPWTILAGTLVPPPELRILGKNTIGGFTYVLKDGEVLMATRDYSGLLVDWRKVTKRDPQAQGELSMAWEAELRLIRPGLIARIKTVSREVLEYIPLKNPVATPVRPYWGQTLAEAEVDIRHNFSRESFQGEGVLETMVTGKSRG